MGTISRKGLFFFFPDLGDGLTMSAVVSDLLEFGVCGKTTAEVLISWS